MVPVSVGQEVRVAIRGFDWVTSPITPEGRGNVRVCINLVHVPSYTLCVIVPWRRHVEMKRVSMRLTMIRIGNELMRAHQVQLVYIA